MLLIDIIKIIGCTLALLALGGWIGKKMIDNEDYFDG